MIAKFASSQGLHKQLLAVLWPYTDWSYLFGDRGIKQTLRVDKELRIFSKEKTTKNLEKSYHGPGTDQCGLYKCSSNWLCAQTSETLCDHTNYGLPGSSSPWNFSGKNTGVDCHFLSPGDLPNLQGSNLSLVSPALAVRLFTTSAPWKPN